MQGQRYSKMLENKSQINQEKASLWRKKEKNTEKPRKSESLEEERKRKKKKNQEKVRAWKKKKSNQKNQE